MRILVRLLFLLALAPVVLAEPKNSETTGSTVRGEQPQSLVAHASWLDQPNRFTCNFNDVKVTGQVLRWLT